MIHLGLHCTWDIYDADIHKLSYVPYIKEVLNTIVDELQLGKIQEVFKQFEPIGVTGFILLEESHISIHTWPEHNYAAVDVFSCKHFDSTAVKKLLAALLDSERIEINELNRGKIPKNNSSVA